MGAHRGKPDTLTSAAKLAGWQTPRANDSEKRGQVEANNRSLNNQAAQLTGWPTESSRDWKDTPGMSVTGINPDGTERTRLDQLPRVAALATHGTTPEPSSAVTEKPGESLMLNPVFSSWLMGYPLKWTFAGLRADSLFQRKSKAESCS